jgi:hypothetical protein
MKQLLTLSLLAVMLFSSCKKDSGSSNNGGADFPKKTEWVGTLDRSGYQYAPPAYMRIDQDLSLVVYAPFFFTINGNFVWVDSLKGKVNTVTEEPNDITRLVATVDKLGEVTMTVYQKKSLTSVSTNPQKLTPFKMDIYTDGGYSVNGTIWSGPVMSGGPTNGMYAYPDMSTIEFSKTTTSYKRNGAYIKEQPTPQFPAPGVLQVSYKQVGPMLFMSGLNESSNRIVDYFGVLLPSNDRMMVFSLSVYARLPYYTQTIAWYGPIGQTPIIERQ